MWTHFYSCVGLGVGAWLLTHQHFIYRKPTFLQQYVPIWLVTSYSCPHFTMSIWSYHWWFRYPFALMLLWEWMYNTSQHTLRYCCSYCFGKWNTCLEGGFPPFPSPHPMINGYPYHQIWLSNFDGCYHCWPDLHKYGATNINDNNTSSDDGYKKKNTILCQTSIRWWFHSPCYWDICVFSLSFWFIFNYLCTYYYRMSSVVFSNPFNVCFSLSTTCVHSPTTCASHSKTGCYTWFGFFISSTHHN